MSGLAPTRAAAPASKLNVVLILADDLGWTDLACYGSKLYETPNIDRLARDGMKFTQAYAACCVCSPTRAAILTSRRGVSLEEIEAEIISATGRSDHRADGR